MNWINSVVRPKIQRVFNKRQVPDNLWRKCPSCGEMIFHRDLVAALNVCPNCDHHLRLETKERFASLFDDADYQIVQ
ncbi:MAG: acetyl-CoA carboxylase carboxyl transferase subunit beta, partial [Nitratireductor sp.]